MKNSELIDIIHRKFIKKFENRFDEKKWRESLPPRDDLLAYYSYTLHVESIIKLLAKGFQVIRTRLENFIIESEPEQFMFDLREGVNHIEYSERDLDLLEDERRISSYRIDDDFPDITFNSESLELKAKLDFFPGFHCYIVLRGHANWILDKSRLDLTSFPDEILETTQLRELILAGNKLLNLHSQLGKLENLRSLNLSGNDFKEIPAEIFELPKLEVLNLKENPIQYVSPEIVELLKEKSIKVIGLDFWHYASLIPSEGVFLRDLSKKMLEEGIYFEFKKWQRRGSRYSLIREIKIEKSHITSLDLPSMRQIPNSIENLSELKILTITRTKLEQLPETIGRLSKLEKLWLQSNQLRFVPTTLKHLKNLKVLDLSGNLIESLPQDIFQGLINLKSMNLGNNPNLVLPDTLVNLKKLEYLGIANLNLTIFPEIICSLPNLQTLSIIRNKLNTLPESICNLKSLKRLFVSYNNLKNLPKCLNKYLHMEKMLLNQNPLLEIPPAVLHIPELTGFNPKDKLIKYIYDKIRTDLNVDSSVITTKFGYNSVRSINGSEVFSVDAWIKFNPKLKLIRGHHHGIVFLAIYRWESTVVGEQEVKESLNKMGALKFPHIIGVIQSKKGFLDNEVHYIELTDYPVILLHDLTVYRANKEARRNVIVNTIFKLDFTNKKQIEIMNHLEILREKMIDFEYFRKDLLSEPVPDTPFLVDDVLYALLIKKPFQKRVTVPLKQIELIIFLGLFRGPDMTTTKIKNTFYHLGIHFDYSKIETILNKYVQKGFLRFHMGLRGWFFSNIPVLALKDEWKIEHPQTQNLSLLYTIIDVMNQELAFPICREFFRIKQQALIYGQRLVATEAEYFKDPESWARACCLKAYLKFCPHSSDEVYPFLSPDILAEVRAKHNQLDDLI